MTEKIIEMRRQMDDGSILTFVPHKADRAVNDTDGNPLVQTYATKSEVETRMGDGSVTNVGGTTVGATGRPIYLLDGVPTECGNVATLEDNTFTKAQTIIMNGPTIQMESTTGGFGLISYQNPNLESRINSLFLTATGVRTPTPTGSSSLEIVNKAYISATDGTTNNILHTTGSEAASGFKRMNPCTYAGSFASRDADHFTVIATFGTGTNTKYFPISLTSRYGGFNGFGQITVDSDDTLTFQIRAVVFGSVSGYVTLKAAWVPIGTDRYVALVAKRATGAGMSLGVHVPFITTSTSITSPVNHLTDDQRKFVPTATDTLYDVVIKKVVVEQ